MLAFPCLSPEREGHFHSIGLEKAHKAKEKEMYELSSTFWDYLQRCCLYLRRAKLKVVGVGRFLRNKCSSLHMARLDCALAASYPPLGLVNKKQ